MIDMGAIANAMQGVVKAASDVKDNTDSLDKGSKVLTNALLVPRALGATSVPLVKLSEAFESFSGLVSGLNILNRVADWACVGKNGDYAWKFWKKQVEGRYCDDGYKSGVKVGQEVLLTAVHAMDFTKFLSSVGAFDLGAAATPLGLAKNIILLPVAALGIWDAAAKISQANKYVQNTAAKVHTWVAKAGLSKGELLAKYQDKLRLAKETASDLMAKMAEATGKAKTEIEAKLGSLDVKGRRWTCYVKEAKALENDTDKLAADSQFKRDCAEKTKRWTVNVDIAKHNAKTEKTKSWLEIAGNICKLVLGILGIIALFVGFATNPAFIVAFALGWVAAHTLGLSKNIYGMYCPMKHIHKPRLAPLPPPVIGGGAPAVPPAAPGGGDAAGGDGAPAGGGAAPGPDVAGGGAGAPAVGGAGAPLADDSDSDSTSTESEDEGDVAPPPPAGDGAGDVVPPLPAGGGAGDVVPPPPAGGGAGDVVPPPPAGGDAGDAKVSPPSSSDDDN